LDRPLTNPAAAGAGAGVAGMQIKRSVHMEDDRDAARLARKADLARQSRARKKQYDQYALVLLCNRCCILGWHARPGRAVTLTAISLTAHDLHLHELCARYIGGLEEQVAALEYQLSQLPPTAQVRTISIYNLKMFNSCAKVLAPNEI
jgi:hypothetical protein